MTYVIRRTLYLVHTHKVRLLEKSTLTQNNHMLLLLYYMLYYKLVFNGYIGSKAFHIISVFKKS